MHADNDPFADDLMIQVKELAAAVAFNWSRYQHVPAFVPDFPGGGAC